jgi:hypothetical protein
LSSRTYTAEEIIALLRNKFSDHQRYALFEQVANGTGWRARSWIDALVVYLWPSDGLLKCAFEVKVNRSDFLNELKNPEKNEWARQMCNEFWFVAPKGIIKEQELPEGVGWMRPHGDTLAIVRHAQRKEGSMPDEFVAAIARAAQKDKKRDVDEMRARILAEDVAYQKALKFKREVQSFVQKRGRGLYEMESEGVEKILSEIVSGDKAKTEQLQVRMMLDRFQGRMVDLFDTFLKVAHISMTEVDDLGNFIISKYGEDESALLIAEKRALLGKSKKEQRGNYKSQGAQKIITAFERMKRIKEKRDEV